MSKKTFGTAKIASIKPEEDLPSVVEVNLTLHEALALQFQIGEACRQINSYNRKTREGRDATVQLQIYSGSRGCGARSRNKAIMVKESRVPKCKRK